MKRRDFAFLTIGLGVGLTLGVGLFVEMILSRMFIFGVSNRFSATLFLASPAVLVLLGAGLLFGERRVQ
jgi:hypothetical protein